MTKQEKIKQAYGRFYGNAERHIRNDGSMSEVIWKSLEIDLEYQDYSTGYFRPKELEGIEDNNGWIPFTHEKLPPNTDYHVTNSRGQIIVLSSNVMNSITINSLADLTHYRPITIPKPPVY